MNLKNNYRVIDRIAIIELTKGHTCILDEDDLILIEPYKWHASQVDKYWYAVTDVWVNDTERIKIYMHAMISGTFGKRGVETDHANGDTLNNRRRNLRIATHSQNNINKGLQKSNTSGFKGVSLHHTGKYAARIYKDNTCYRLGLYETKEEAAKVYNDAARRLHGEFAWLNRLPLEDN